MVTHPTRLYVFASWHNTPAALAVLACGCALELLSARRAAETAHLLGGVSSIGIAITLTIVRDGETATPRIQCHVATRASPLQPVIFVPVLLHSLPIDLLSR